MSKIISIINHKGGVGKTTTVLNLGAALGLMDKRVLLVDFDPQANLTQSLGLMCDRNIHTALNALRNGIKEDLPIVNVSSQKLDIVPSHLDLSAAEIMLLNETGREYFLKELLADVVESYDYILVDCPPSLGVLTTNALTASTDLIIPIQTEILAIQGLNTLNVMIDKVKSRINKDLNLMGYLLTQYDKRTNLNNSVVESIREKYQDKVFNTVIRKNIVIAEAPSQKTSVIYYNDMSNGAIDYRRLAGEICC